MLKKVTKTQTQLQEEILPSVVRMNLQPRTLEEDSNWDPIAQINQIVTQISNPPVENFYAKALIEERVERLEGEKLDLIVKNLIKRVRSYEKLKHQKNNLINEKASSEERIKKLELLHQEEFSEIRVTAKTARKIAEGKVQSLIKELKNLKKQEKRNSPLDPDKLAGAKEAINDVIDRLEDNAILKSTIKKIEVSYEVKVKPSKEKAKELSFEEELPMKVDAVFQKQMEKYSEKTRKLEQKISQLEIDQTSFEKAIKKIKKLHKKSIQKYKQTIYNFCFKPAITELKSDVKILYSDRKYCAKEIKKGTDPFKRKENEGYIEISQDFDDDLFGLIRGIKKLAKNFKVK